MLYLKHSFSIKSVSFLKWANPVLFFIYFPSSQTNIFTIFTSICEKMTIQYMVPNPRPLEHESPSITTRPGLPPSLSTYLGTNSTAFEFSRLVNYFTMTLKTKHYSSESHVLNFFTKRSSLFLW